MLTETKMKPTSRSKPTSDNKSTSQPASQSSTTSTHKENENVAQKGQEIRNLIEHARSEPAGISGAFLLAATSAVLFWASFHPLDWGFLAWVSLVPLVMLVRLPQRTRWMYRSLFFWGIVQYLFLMQWMRFGHPSMYLALASLSIYLGLYVPLFVALSRYAVHRLGIPLLLGVPLIWTGLEYLQAHLMTGFAWYYLGHTQYRWIELIQICDLFGLYGLSFLVAMSSVSLAYLIPSRYFQKFRLLPFAQKENENAIPVTLKTQFRSLCITSLVLSLAVGYGFYRRSEYRTILPSLEAGPRIALVQGNFNTSVGTGPADRAQISWTYNELTGQAVGHQPDIIIWPESMFQGHMLIPQDELSDEDLQRLAPAILTKDWREHSTSHAIAEYAQKANAAMIVGVDSYVAEPNRIRHYASAAFARPSDNLVSARYDKMHRVVFGEYVPLKEWFPFLHKVTPYSTDFGIAKGKGSALFQYKTWSFSPVICFEDTVPHLVKGIVKAENQNEKKLDVLVNITNDGWFHPKTKMDEKIGSAASEQHLVTALFRSVETRTPMVRSVNTGISAFIDSEGVVREPEVFFDRDGQDRTSMRDDATGNWNKQFNGVLVETMPLDSRSSLYVQWGDWFAQLCCAGCFFVIMMAFVNRWRNKPTCGE